MKNIANNLKIAFMNATNISISSDGSTAPSQYQPQKLFNVLIKYPEDYTGAKVMRDNVVKRGVSEEGTNALVKQGIATIMTDEEADAYEANAAGGGSE